MKRLSNLSEKIAKYLLAAILIIVPLFPKFPLMGVPGTYVAIRFEDILLLFLAIITLPKIFTDYKSLLKDKIILAFLIFLGSGLISLIAGAFLTQTVAIQLGVFHWARRIEYITPFLAAYILMPKKEIGANIHFYVKILMIVMGLTFLYGFGQRYFRFPVIITQNEQYSKGVALYWTPGSHINSTFAGHYDLAAFVVLILPIFLTSLFILKGKLTKLWLTLFSAAGLWLLINSVSRIAQASYLSAVFIAMFLVRKYKALIAVIIVSLIFMLMSSGLDMRFARAIQVIYERVATGKMISGVRSHFIALADEITLPGSQNAEQLPAPTPVPALSDVSIAIRVNVEWPRAFRAFLKNPLIGTGYSSIDLATDNDFLRMLGETGILGLAAIILIFFRIGKVFVNAWPLSTKLSALEICFVTGIIGGVVGALITSFFIDLFEASKFAIIFWMLVGLAVSLVQSKIYVE